MHRYKARLSRDGKRVESTKFLREEPWRGGGPQINAEHYFVEARVIYVNATDELDAFVKVTTWIEEQQHEAVGGTVQP
jgi:hypothetical protein